MRAFLSTMTRSSSTSAPIPSGDAVAGWPIVFVEVGAEQHRAPDLRARRDRRAHADDRVRDVAAIEIAALGDDAVVDAAVEQRDGGRNAGACRSGTCGS